MKEFADVDAYLSESERWPDEIAALRRILLACGLGEQVKWGKPCYDADGANIAIIQEMKDFLALMFFKGTLLADPDSVLHDQGPNSRSARRMQFTSVAEVDQLAGAVAAHVQRAIAAEEAGLEVGPAPELILVDELRDRMEADRAIAEAFAALTPGRQREYNLYFSDAKQAKTRKARVEKYVPKILQGKGFRDR